MSGRLPRFPRRRRRGELRSDGHRRCCARHGVARVVRGEALVRPGGGCHSAHRQACYLRRIARRAHWLVTPLRSAGFRADEPPHAIPCCAAAAGGGAGLSLVTQPRDQGARLRRLSRRPLESSEWADAAGWAEDSRTSRGLSLASEVLLQLLVAAVAESPSLQPGVGRGDEPAPIAARPLAALLHTHAHEWKLRPLESWQLPALLAAPCAGSVSATRTLEMAEELGMPSQLREALRVLPLLQPHAAAATPAGALDVQPSHCSHTLRRRGARQRLCRRKS